MSAAPSLPQSFPFISARAAVSKSKPDRIVDIGLTYSATLHRPYLDLGPLSEAPLHTRSIPFAFTQLIEPAAPVMPLQVHPSPALRDAVTFEGRLHQYRIERAADLAADLRTDAWQLMVDLLSRARSLDDETRMRLVHLLGALGLYADIEEVASATATDTVLAAKASFAVLKRQPSAAAWERDVSVLATLAQDSSASPVVRLAAAGALVVLASRSRPAQIWMARRWRAAGLEQLSRLTPENDWREAIYASAFWRAASYVPYLERDATATADELNEAERLAKLFIGADPAQQLLQQQNLHPLLETRVREAVEFGRFDLATQRAQELVHLDPLDGKVHIRLGDVLYAKNDLPEAARAYETAVHLGAPFAALGSYLAGACHETLGDLDRAREAYQRALHDAPAAFSAAKRLAAAARLAGDKERLTVAESSLRWMLRHAHASSERNISIPPNKERVVKTIRRPPSLKVVGEAGRRSLLQPGELSASGALAAHLLSPYFDLGARGGPNHARATFRLGELLDSDQPLPLLQRHTPTWFRRAILWDIGIAAYEGGDPRHLPTPLRSGAWRKLCESIDNWSELSVDRRHRTAILLNRLGFYDLSVQLTCDSAGGHLPSTLIPAAVALYKVGRRLEGETMMARAAENGGLDPAVRFASMVNMVSHHGKISGNILQLERWAEMAKNCGSLSTRNSWEPADMLVVRSSALRAQSFLPFRKGNRQATWSLLNQAETIAVDALSAFDENDVAARENMFALLETRINAASAFGDFASALRDAERLIVFEPLDGKSFLLLGQAQIAAGEIESAERSFRSAAKLGAPHDAEAWHRQGSCREHLGDVEGAKSGYRKALAADPWAVTPVLALNRLLRLRSVSTHESSVFRWCRARTASLRDQARTVRAQSEVR